MKPGKHFKSYSRRLRHKVFRNYFGTVTHFDVNRKVAAITFDDGPHPIYTPIILKLLQRFDVKATFFVVGVYAKKYPGIIKNISEHGHCIGNHTWDHKLFNELSTTQRWSQVSTCAKYIKPYMSKFFRHPWGKQSHQSRFDTFLFGYDDIGWNVHANDWDEQDADKMAETLLTSLSPGSMLLLHDNICLPSKKVENQVYEPRESMITALEYFLIKTFNEYQFVTIPQLFQTGMPVRGNWIDS